MEITYDCFDFFLADSYFIYGFLEFLNVTGGLFKLIDVYCLSSN